MATLTFEAGPISSAISASDAKAQEVIEAIAGTEGTNAEKADAFMTTLKSMIVNEARRCEAVKAAEAADAPEWEE